MQNNKRSFLELDSNKDALNSDVRGALDSNVVDWKTMFKKYANIVGEEEGVTFLHESDWSPEEWHELQQLSGLSDLKDQLHDSLVDSLQDDYHV